MAASDLHTIRAIEARAVASGRDFRLPSGQVFRNHSPRSRARRQSKMLAAGMALVAASGAFAGCSEPPESIRLEVYSWWQRNEESAAFEDLRTEFQRQQPGVVVANLADPNAPDQQARVAGQMLAGSPPSTFQANIGAGVLRWAAVDSHKFSDDGSLDGQETQETLLADLGSLLASSSLVDQLPDELLQELRLGNTQAIYAVPLNIHHLNVVYYNVADLEKRLGSTEFPKIEQLCPDDPAAPPLNARIAIGVDDDFSLIQLAFESILPALTSAEFYDNLFRGNLSDGLDDTDKYSREVRRALECVQYLSKSFVRNPSYKWDWAQAVQAVSSGDATFTVTGDWANSPLAPELEQGSVRMQAFPGTESAFVFTSDTFPLPLAAPHAREAAAFLEMMASADAQRLFSERKGSIPARKDAAIGTTLVELRSSTRDAFLDKNIRKVAATSGRFPPYYPRLALRNDLRDMTSPRADAENLETTLRNFRANERLFSRWQERVNPGQP